MRTTRSRRLWAVRDATGELHPQLPHHLAFDVGLPVARMDDYVSRCRQALQGQTSPVDGFTTALKGTTRQHSIEYRPIELQDSG